MTEPGLAPCLTLAGPILGSKGSRIISFGQLSKTHSLIISLNQFFFQEASLVPFVIHRKTQPPAGQGRHTGVSRACGGKGELRVFPLLNFFFSFPFPIASTSLYLKPTRSRFPLPSSQASSLFLTASLSLS